MKHEEEKKPPILHVTPETKAKKQALKNNTHHANKLKRRRAGILAKQIDGQDLWSSLSLKDKESMILNWSVNGGVIAGRRYNRAELAKKLGLKDSEFSRMMDGCQRGFEEMFSKSAQMKTTVFAVAAKAIHQLQDNRARAVMHNDILDEEMTIIRNELEKVRKKVPKDARGQNVKDLEIGRLMNYFRSISYQKLESMRILLEATEGHNKFLELFASQKTGRIPGLQDLEEDASAERKEYVDQKSVIALLEDHARNPLPSHKDLTFDMGTKNPNAGFEALAANEPKLDD